MEYVLIVISSLLSGILGVIISAFYYSKKEKKNIQVNLVTELFGNRNKLTSDIFNNALNKVPVVFCESSVIIEEYIKLHDYLLKEHKPKDINNQLFLFLNLLVKHTKLSKNGFSDEIILRVYGINNGR